jgi:hypothetical protein
VFIERVRDDKETHYGMTFFESLRSRLEPRNFENKKNRPAQGPGESKVRYYVAPELGCSAGFPVAIHSRSYRRGYESDVRCGFSGGFDRRLGGVGVDIGKSSEAEGQYGGESENDACGFHVYLISVF